MAKKKQSLPIDKIAIAVGILIVLLIIPFTRAVLFGLVKLILGFALWVILLFALIMLVKWLIVPKK